MNITKIINDLKKELINRPYDSLHDVSHHYETWKNCFNIIRSEDIKVNKNILYIAAWSHDLETYYKNNNDFKRLRRVLKNNEVNSKIVDKVIQIIEEHSFSKDQILKESQILFDADKLEHISIPRWEYTLQAYVDGLMDDDRIEYYSKLQDKLLEKLPNRLHFQYSKEIYSKRIKIWYKYAQKKGILSDDNHVVISSNIKL